MSWSGFSHPPPPPPPPPGPAGAPSPPPPPPPHHGPNPGGYPFWDFIHSLDPRYRQSGNGVDHTGGIPAGFPAGFTFSPSGFEGWAGPHGFSGFWGRRGGFGHRGRGGRSHGRRGRRGCGEEDPSGDEEMRDANATDAEKGEYDPEKDDSPETVRVLDDDEHPDPPEEVPFMRHERRGGGRRGFGPRGGRFGPHGHHGHHHGPHGPHARHHHGPPPPYPGPEAANQWAQQIRDYVERVRAQAMGVARGGEDGEYEVEDSFTPPADIFNAPTNWTIHIALPGAKKEDVAVNWDAAKSSLAISGVVYRPGDEGFLSGMISGERKVGLFERSIKLPPAGGDEKEEADGDGITAKLEDGILVVTVPKVEKEGWTEVRKVDIL